MDPMGFKKVGPLDLPLILMKGFGLTIQEGVVNTNKKLGNQSFDSGARSFLNRGPQ
jgi:hypothetical protein